MGGSGKVEMITSKGCSKVFSDVSCSTLGSNSFRDLQPPRPSMATSASLLLHSTSNSPFSGLVICVTGLSKVRLNESLYVVKSFGENHMANDNLSKIGFGNPCLPVAMLENAKQSNFIQRSRLHLPEHQKRRASNFSGQTVYIDPDVSAELRNKVVEAALEEGASLANRWSVGHDATHVVCEGSSVRKYLGHSNNLVSPLWVLKTAKEIRSRRLVHLSADLARHVGTMLGNVPSDIDLKDSDRIDGCRDEPKSSLKEKQSIAILAKKGVRNRRTQVYQTPIKPLARNVLLDSINWSMSEPSTCASICMDSFSFDDSKTFEFVDANESTKEPDACFVNFLRPLSESSKPRLQDDESAKRWTFWT